MRALVVATVLAPLLVIGAARADEVAPPAPDAGGALRPPSQVPKLYLSWLASLPARDRRQVERFCRAHPRDVQELCGGIGPLHIPAPPSQIASSTANLRQTGYPTREAWLRALSKAQRAYVRRQCADTDDDAAQYSDLCGATPIAISFDGGPVALGPADRRFAYLPGDPVATAWPIGAPWLARDLDGDGAITSGAELFGGNTALASGATGASGFDALDELDANGDRVLDARDPGFHALVLWTDDGDRVSAPGELRRADDVIVAIGLDDQLAPRCDGAGNCERERAPVTWRDGAQVRVGAAIDLHLRIRD